MSAYKVLQPGKWYPNAKKLRDFWSCESLAAGIGIIWLGDQEELQEECTGPQPIQKSLLSKWDRPAFARKSPLHLKAGFRTSHRNPIKLCLHEQTDCSKRDG